MNRIVNKITFLCGILFLSLGVNVSRAEAPKPAGLLVPEGESPPLGELYALKLGRIGTLAFSNDGKTLASGSSDDGRVCLWALATGRPIRCADPDKAKGRTTALAFSPQGTWIAAGHIDGSVETWHTDETRVDPLCRLGPLPEDQKLGRPVAALGVAADGSLLSVSGRNGSLRSCPRVFENAAGDARGPAKEPSTMPPLDGAPSSLFDLAAFDPTAQSLIVASGSGLGVWPASGGSRRWLEPSLASLVVSLAVSPDGKLLAVGFLSGIISVRDMVSGQKRCESSAHGKPIRALAFSPDGKRLAAGSDDRSVSLWDTKSCSKLPRTFTRDAGITALAFHPHGALLASAAEDAGITLWEVESGNELPPLRANADWVSAVRFNRQGQYLATASDNNEVRIWQRKPGDRQGPEWSVLCETGRLRTGKIHALAFSPAEKELTVAVASDSERVQILKAEPAGCTWIASPDANPDWVKSLAYDNEGRRLAVGSDNGALTIWDFASKKQRLLKGPNEEKAHRDEVGALAFSSRGRWLASASFDKTVRLWEPGSGVLVHTFPAQAESIKSVDFSPDENVLAMAAGKEVSLWDVATRQPLPNGPLVHEHPVNVLRFSTDGKLLATGSVGAQLWDVATGQKRLALTVDEEPAAVLALDWNPTGNDLAAATLGRLALWRSTERKPYAQLWQGSRGEWASYTVGGLLYRRDSGGLLLKRDDNGTLTPVSPPQPSKAQLHLSITVPEIQPNRELPEVHAVIRNDGSGPAYWVWLEDSPMPGESKEAKNLSLLPDPPEMRLDPGQSIERRVRISLREHAWLPLNPIRFCLTVRHATSGHGKWPCEDELSRPVTLPLRSFFWQNWRQLASFGTLLLLAVFVGLRLRRRHRGLSHPVIQSYLAGENPLGQMTLKEFPDTDKALRHVEKFNPSLRRQILTAAGISNDGWQRALSAADSPDSCANVFAESLLISRNAPLSAFFRNQDVAAYKINLPPLLISFPADMLIICTSATLTPQAALSRCKPEDLQRPKVALLVDMSTARVEPATVKQSLKDAFPGTLFVVIDEPALRRILIAREPAQAKAALREEIVRQCELRQIVPYRRGGNEIPADEESFFFGRQTELDLMLEGHRRNFLIVGPRFMGKSSLLNAFSRELCRRYPTVKVLKHQLPSGSLRSIHTIDNSVRGDTPDAFYDSVIQRSTDYQIFLLDEADKFIELENQQGYPFATVMRALHAQGRASFILAGYKELHEAMRTADHPLRNFGELLRLEPLDFESAGRMILGPLTALGLRFADEAATVDWLRAQTACRPHLLAQACSAIVQLHKPLSAEPLTLQEVTSSVLSYGSLHDAFGNWEARSGEPLIDCVVIRAALLLDKATLPELEQFLRTQGANLTQHEIDRSVSRLYSMHYALVPDSEGRLSCPVPMLRYFLRDSQPDSPHGKKWPTSEARLRGELEQDIAALRSRSSGG